VQGENFIVTKGENIEYCTRLAGANITQLLRSAYINVFKCFLFRPRSLHFFYLISCFLELFSSVK